MRKFGVGKTYPSRRSRRKSKSNGKLRRKFAWLLNSKKNLRRGFQKLRRRLSPRYVVFPLVAVVLAGLTYTIFFSSLLSIQVVMVRVTPGENKLEEETLKQEIKKRVSGANLLFLSSKNLAFLSEDLNIAEIKMEKKWLHGLTVEIEKRVPKVMVSDAQGRLFLADDEGVVFPRGKVEGLSTIQVPEPFSLGEKIESGKISFVLALLSQLSSEGFGLEFLEASESIHLKVSGGPEIISPSQAEKIQELLSILKNYRSRGGLLKKIDLRHVHPVVEYE